MKSVEESLRSILREDESITNRRVFPPFEEYDDGGKNDTIAISREREYCSHVSRRTPEEWWNVAAGRESSRNNSDYLRGTCDLIQGAPPLSSPLSSPPPTFSSSFTFASSDSSRLNRRGRTGFAELIAKLCQSLGDTCKDTSLTVRDVAEGR